MYWLGPDYQEPGVAGNDIRRTNVPAIRIAYRYEALNEELRLLGNAYKSRQEVKITNRKLLKRKFVFQREEKDRRYLIQTKSPSLSNLDRVGKIINFFFFYFKYLLHKKIKLKHHQDVFLHLFRSVFLLSNIYITNSLPFVVI